MATTKKNSAGEDQPVDGKQRYAEMSTVSTEELRERQMIELPDGSHPPVEKAYRFNRLDTKHHKRHVREMGFKDTHEYEQAAVEFFNSDKGRLYYSKARRRFYRYDGKTRRFASSGEGSVYTFYLLSQKQFEVKVRSDECVEY